MAFAVIAVGISLAQSPFTDLETALKEIDSSWQQTEAEMDAALAQAEQAAEIAASHALAVYIFTLLLFIGTQFFWICMLIDACKKEENKSAWLPTIVFLNTLGALIYLFHKHFRPAPNTPTAMTQEYVESTVTFACEGCRSELNTLPGKSIQCRQCGRINTA